MAYYLFILIVGAERFVELAVARRNTTWSIAHGGKEFGRGHYPLMVVMHGLLLVGCIVEVWALHRPFIPRLGWPMVAIVVFSTVIRWWCIAVLGKYWNTRIIVIPGAPLVRRGPYRWLNHPNYAAVIAEVTALPLVHSAWLTAIVFTIANAPGTRCANPRRERRTGLRLTVTLSMRTAHAADRCYQPHRRHRRRAQRWNCLVQR